eukprot:7389099-Prymnesium_polylepis.3
MRTMRSKAKRAALSIQGARMSAHGIARLGQQGERDARAHRVFNNRVAVGNSSAISYNVSASIEYVSANVKHRAVFAVF